MRDLRSLRSFPLRRREVIALGIGAFVVAAVPLAGRRRRGAHRLTVPVMGTVADLVVVADDRARARAALDAAAAELRRVDALMTRFRTDSDVGRLNAAERRTAIDVTDETAAVVRHALDWASRTDGRFDPCLGVLSARWSDDTPDVSAYRDAELHRALDVDRHAGGDVLVLTREEAALDLGGIAKGHAVDRAVRVLRAHGIRDGLVNAGGDLVALGTSADGDPWRVGVRDPDDPSRLCDTLDVSDRAVATSGDYETEAWRSGRRVHHLLDPRTAAPRETDVRSLTVIADDCRTADVAATALFGLTAHADADRMLSGTSASIVSSA